MAVSKIWKVTARLDQVIDYATNPEKTAAKEYSPEQYQALADVLQYAKDEEKTEREFYVGGINCNASTARDQFVTVKEQFDKCDGIQAYHGYLSFKDEPNITPELAQQIGTEFAKRVWGDRFQVVVTTHLNTKHLHCHFVVNSVSFVDGKRMQNNEKHWRYFRHIADELCRQHQLDVIENPKRGTGKNYYARKLHEAGMPNYVDSAKAVIDEAISKSNSYADFKYILRQMGASFDDSPNHKYQVLRVKGYQKNIRLTRLGDDYSLDRIKERIYENRNSVKLEPFQKGYYYRPKQYVLLTREHKIRKVGGLYGLYLHYCYKLGYLPKYQKQNPARLHYLLREDLMKLDQITAQVRLLGREHISTSEQLFSYKSKVEDEIKTLTADRTHLRNEIRKVNIDDDLLSGKKQQISALSERLKELRKEVRLCDGIAGRSGVMRENLNAVLADEEKIKNNRKENRDYEHRR
ncbi:relaxase/mobilization nuclease domain-containing protein [Longicatena caecimuris]|uniref:relaxase/mobilization nuclease domain-containing protein n=1 Tax=Longicatena caecimuris TaxID=1796635 RepID=UPI003AB8D1B2